MPSNHLIHCCPLLLLLSIFPSIRVFSNESFFASGGQSIGASASVLPMNIQDWFPLELTGLIPLQSKGLSRVFSNTTVQKHQFFGTLLFFMVQLSHPYMTTGKTIALTRWIFVSKVMSLLFNMLSRFVIAFLPRSKCIHNVYTMGYYSTLSKKKSSHLQQLGWTWKARIFSVMLNRSGEGEHLCLNPVLRRKISSLSPLGNVSCSYFIDIIYQVWKIPLYPSFAKSFYQNECQILSNTFSVLIWMSPDFDMYMNNQGVPWLSFGCF